MPKLNHGHKTFIVQRVAMYDTPSQVAEAVKLEFGIDVPREQIRNYNPSQVTVARKWKEIHDATRAQFLESVSEIPIAQRAVRLRRLDRAAVKAESIENYSLMAQLCEQAARELGGMFTNHRSFDHSGSFVPPSIRVCLVDRDGNEREI